MSEFKTSHQCVELICQQGCTVVREVMIKLEQHQSVTELEHLSDQQKQDVLVELSAIMSVYDQTNDE